MQTSVIIYDSLKQIEGESANIVGYRDVQEY